MLRIDLQKMFSYAIAAITLFTLVSSEIEYDDNYRYIAVWDDTKSVTWVEALQYCIEEMETVLGSIHNDSDQESVLLAARATGANVSSDSGLTSNDYVWIGLNDTDDEGNFAWVDGSSLDYDNWQADEPKAPDCVNIINTEWYASTCSTAATTSVWVCNRPYVPAPGPCTAEWTKNPQRVYFSWDNVTIPDGDDASDYSYYLGYWVDDEIVYYDIQLDTQFKNAGDFDFSVGTSIVPGTIQTKYTGYGSGTARYSKPVECTTITQEPSVEPTGYPSQPPTGRPSASPTMEPTWTDPYLFIGGDICSGERCDCAGFSTACVGDDVYISWSPNSIGNVITFEQRRINFGEQTYIFWDLEYLGASNTTNVTWQAGLNSSTSGVILDKTTESAIEMDPSSGSLMVTFDSDSSTNEARDSVDVDQISLNVDDNRGVFLYRLSIKNCSVNETVGSHIYECNIVYPSEIYIRVNTVEVKTNNLTENEIEEWLIWLLVVIGIFAIILAFLIYRFWWKNRASTKTLHEKENEREAAIEEAEMGFGGGIDKNNVNFNPMAAGARNSGLVLPSGIVPSGSHDGNTIGDRADVTVEKFNQRSEFGQVAPKRPQPPPPR